MDDTKYIARYDILGKMDHSDPFNHRTPIIETIKRDFFASDDINAKEIANKYMPLLESASSQLYEDKFSRVSLSDITKITHIHTGY